MNMQSQYELLHAEGSPTPIKGWVRGVPLEDAAHQQLRNIASIPFVGPWVAVMPDVHLGRGATVGSVIPTRGAVIPAAVGVDIGCGMAAVRTTLRAADLPDSLAQLRTSIERSVPVGNGPGGDHRKLPDSVATMVAESGLVQRSARSRPSIAASAWTSWTGSWARWAAATTSSSSAWMRRTRCG
jgi:tRNA-splicing ligase RtcB